MNRGGGGGVGPAGGRLTRGGGGRVGPRGGYNSHDRGHYRGGPWNNGGYGGSYPDNRRVLIKNRFLILSFIYSHKAWVFTIFYREKKITILSTYIQYTC